MAMNVPVLPIPALKYIYIYIQIAGLIKEGIAIWKRSAVFV